MDRDENKVTRDFHQQIGRLGSTFQSEGKVKSQTVDPAAWSAEARALVLQRRQLALERRETTLLRRGGSPAPAFIQTPSHAAVENTATIVAAENKSLGGGGALVLLAGEYAHPDSFRLRIERLLSQPDSYSPARHGAENSYSPVWVHTGGRDAMPRHMDRQESGAESQESILGEGVPINGVDYQAGRRAHMREQNTARQGAEWHLAHPPIVRGDGDYHELVAERVGEVRAELALINAAHQTWLVAQAAKL